MVEIQRARKRLRDTAYEAFSKHTGRLFRNQNTALEAQRNFHAAAALGEDRG